MSRLAGLVRELTLTQVFGPLHGSVLLEKADECGLHASCPVPLAVVKAVEVKGQVALPTDVIIRFESPAQEGGHGE